MIIHRVIGYLAVLSLLSFAPMALADAPKSVTEPDRHSVVVTGKVSLFRVQVEGMRMGKGKDQVDAEVFVSLDSDPKMVYAIQLKRTSPPANKAMADTLRDAYISKAPVTIYRQLDVKKSNNYKVLMVQLN